LRRHSANVRAMAESPPLRRRGFALLGALVAVLIAAAVQAEGAAPARPRFLDLRYDENWSVLAGQEAAPGSDFFDRVKYIPLNESGSIWLSFGAQLRARLEIWEDFGFGGPPGESHDDTYLLSRYLFHADLHLTPWLRLFVQGKSTFVTPSRDLPGGNRKADVDQADLQNGFADVTFPELAGVPSIGPTLGAPSTADRRSCPSRTGRRPASGCGRSS